MNKNHSNAASNVLLKFQRKKSRFKRKSSHGKDVLYDPMPSPLRRKRKSSMNLEKDKIIENLEREGEELRREKRQLRKHLEVACQYGKDLMEKNMKLKNDLESAEFERDKFRDLYQAESRTSNDLERIVFKQKVSLNEFRVKIELLGGKYHNRRTEVESLKDQIEKIVKNNKQLKRKVKSLEFQCRGMKEERESLKEKLTMDSKSIRNLRMHQELLVKKLSCANMKPPAPRYRSPNYVKRRLSQRSFSNIRIAGFSTPTRSRRNVENIENESDDDDDDENPKRRKSGNDLSRKSRITRLVGAKMVPNMTRRASLVSLNVRHFNSLAQGGGGILPDNHQTPLQALCSKRERNWQEKNVIEPTESSYEYSPTSSYSEDSNEKDVAMTSPGSPYHEVEIVEKKSVDSEKKKDENVDAELFYAATQLDILQRTGILDLYLPKNQRKIDILNNYGKMGYIDCVKDRFCWSSGLPQKKFLVFCMNLVLIFDDCSFEVLVDAFSILNCLMLSKVGSLGFVIKRKDAGTCWRFVTKSTSEKRTWIYIFKNMKSTKYADLMTC